MINTSIAALILVLLFAAYVGLRKAVPMLDYASATDVRTFRQMGDSFLMSTAPDVCSSATTPTDCRAPCVWNLATGMCQTQHA
jgi:hypothetical protein